MMVDAGLIRYPARICVFNPEKREVFCLEISNYNDGKKKLNQLFNVEKLCERDTRALAEILLVETILFRCLIELNLIGLLREGVVKNQEFKEKSEEDLLRELIELIDGELLLIKYLNEKSWDDVTKKVYQRVFGISVETAILKLRDLHSYYRFFNQDCKTDFANL